MCWGGGGGGGCPRAEPGGACWTECTPARTPPALNPHKCVRSKLGKSTGLYQQVEPHLEQQRVRTWPQLCGQNDTEGTPGGLEPCPDHWESF